MVVEGWSAVRVIPSGMVQQSLIPLMHKHIFVTKNYVTKKEHH